MNEVRKYFGYANVRDFRADWSALTEADKAELRNGVADGSLTYPDRDALTLAA